MFWLTDQHIPPKLQPKPKFASCHVEVVCRFPGMRPHGAALLQGLQCQTRVCKSKSGRAGRHFCMLPLRHWYAVSAVFSIVYRLHRIRAECQARSAARKQAPTTIIEDDCGACGKRPLTPRQRVAWPKLCSPALTCFGVSLSGCGHTVNITGLHVEPGVSACQITCRVKRRTTSGHASHTALAGSRAPLPGDS